MYKGRESVWKKATRESFDILEKKVIITPILVLPNFYKLFEVDCDASHIRIGVVLS